MLDGYELMQAQEMLQVGDEQFPRFLPRLRALQEARRRGQMQRARVIQELRGMTQSRSAPDEARLKDSLRTLDDLDARSAAGDPAGEGGAGSSARRVSAGEIPPLRSDDGAAQGRTAHARPAGQPAEPAAEPINPVVQFPHRWTGSQATVLAGDARFQPGLLAETVPDAGAPRHEVRPRKARFHPVVWGGASLPYPALELYVLNAVTPVGGAACRRDLARARGRPAGVAPRRRSPEKEDRADS